MVFFKKKKNLFQELSSVVKALCIAKTIIEHISGDFISRLERSSTCDEAFVSFVSG